MSVSKTNPSLSRRRLLRSAMGFVASGTFGCNQIDLSVNDAGRTRRGNGEPAHPADTGSLDAGAGWARGGTAVMSDHYPDPFTEPGDDCALTCSMTLGPCHAQTIERRDISEGQPGLPMRLSLRVLDDLCRPEPNAIVDVWHTAPRGMYSGADAPSLCTLSDPEAVEAHFFRGTQRSDAAGRVDFDSCFPGWYSGRALHIHLSVTRADGVVLVTQLFFDDALGDAIIAHEPHYRERGPRNTTNQTDGVLAGALLDPYLLATERMSDGVLLASKSLIVRSSLEEALCVAGRD